MNFAAILERLSKPENPYPGLRPFDTSEAHLFFGRDQQVLDLLDRLARNRFAAVLGLSGSGKSSIVRAGLIPVIQEGRLLERGLRWRVAIARPAGAPFANLALALDCGAADLRTSSHGLIDHARTLLTEGEGLFVLIDQFEELFRYKDRAVTPSGETPDHAAATSEAAAFIDLLLASTRSPLPIYVVITMRTDYLGDCAEFPEFPEALNESQYLVPRLTREQRRQSIEGPLSPVRISSAVVEQILNDAGDEPDQLPILQHALMRTWSRWNAADPGGERPIDIADYDAAGGFRGALNQHADELLSSPAILAEPKFVEIVFRRLTALGRGNRERRDPARLSELWDLCNAVSAERRLRVNAIIDVFRRGSATFLTPRAGELTPDTYIDIAHESLIRNWKVLAGNWLPDEEREAKGLIELLGRARGWRDREKEVLIGLDLTGAMEWDSRRNRSPRWAEHYLGPGAIDEVEAFLAASRENFDESEKRRLTQLEFELTSEKQLREAAEFRGKAERSSASRTKIFAVILAVFLFAALGLAWGAWIANVRAGRSREAAELVVKSATLLPLRGQRNLAFAFALNGFSIDNTPYSREAIARTFPQSVIRLEVREGGGPTPMLDAVFSPDGKRVLTASVDHIARLWDASTGERIGTLSGHTQEIHRAAFSFDGQRLVTASYDRTARVWNALTGQLIHELKGHPGDVNNALFSPDGSLVITASADGGAWVWNATTGSVIVKLNGHGGDVNSAMFSPDGQRVVTASDDHEARVWNAMTGKLIAEMKGHQAPVNSAEFSPDGQRVVTASLDKTARVWNAATGEPIFALNGHTAELNDAEFSPDGQRIVTASDDRTARVWNAASGQLVARLTGHLAEVNDARFSPDGQRVVTASRDYTARVWNASDGAAIAILEGHSDNIGSALFSPDSQRVVTASYDGSARVWNIAGAGRLLSTVGHDNDVYSATFSPDGKFLVTASADKTARVSDGNTGKQIAALRGHQDDVNSAVFSPDGKLVVTASSDRTARVWSATSGQNIVTLMGHAGIVNSAMFSQDGQRVVTASADQSARVWNATRTGPAIQVLSGHAGAVNAAIFSPDGQRVATASDDRTAWIWNVATGKEIAKFEGHTDRVISVAFSPDGERAVTASDDQTAQVWSATTGQRISTLKGHVGTVNTAMFSPDGRWVVTASDDRTARVWDAATGRQINEMTGHSERVRSAEFSRDGKRVLTASLDATARVWNAATGQLFAKLEGHSQSVMAATFSPDGQRVATASLDHTARIYSILTFDDVVRLLSSK